jgi:exosome complex exonuclease RRP6
MLDLSMRHDASMAKPQLRFEKKVDNFPAGAWKPIIINKPHAQAPLVDSVVLSDDADTGYGYIAAALPLLLVVKDDERKPQLLANARQKLRKPVKQLTPDRLVRFKHPYESEILSLQYPDAVFKHADPIMYQPIDSTEATWVDTVEAFESMMADLKEAREIAVDLEHHDYRTYYGLTSLMQISTRRQDWLVDTLVPWRHRLEALNEVFANPNIVKVCGPAFPGLVVANLATHQGSPRRVYGRQVVATGSWTLSRQLL